MTFESPLSEPQGPAGPAVSEQKHSSPLVIGTFEMMSRKGETYNVPHLKSLSESFLETVNNTLKNFGHDAECWALDGELYIHGVKLQRNII